jgi:hypothetical protein
VSSHSTAQLLVQQYRERSPSPYVGMKEKSEIIRKLYENELPIFDAGILSRLPKKSCKCNLDPSYIRLRRNARLLAAEKA